MKHHTQHMHRPSGQQGVALFTALMLLLIITILGISSVRTGVMEAQMSTNEELRIAAFETAESILDAVVSNPANTQVVGDVGRKICTTNWPTTCDTSGTIVIPPVLVNTVTDAGQLMANVVRLAPAVGPAPPGYSVIKYQSATFRAHARYDGTPTGQGKTEVLEGIIVAFPKSL